MTQPARTDQNAPGRPGTTVVTGLMLFALFFGAGNLIFPPVLGASAGDRLPAVMAGFLITGVLLPLVAVIAVSTSGEGILGLARRVGGRFGAVAPAAVYLSIGPLYAIPRVVTVAYELATRPVLELLGAAPGRWTLPAHAAGFLVVSVLIALRPSRLADRVGRWLTPALLVLIAVLCVATIAGDDVVERAASGPYAASPFSTGLTQGYLTMDVLAATVFGIVVIQTLRSRGIGSTGRVVRATAAAGGIAAALLAAVYIGLAMIGTRTGGAADDGTALLRSAASSALGPAGVIVFAAIVILACLTTSVGLLSAWAGYAYATLPRTTFSRHLVAGAGCALILSNLGLAVIIRIVAPLTLLLYPITITLVAATILDVVAPGRLRTAYTWPVAVAGVLGLVSALAEAGWDAPSALLARSGAWNGSTGWIAPTLLALVLGAALDVRAGRWSTPASDMSDAAEDVERAVIGQR
ncbi:branched-chain amino acid transport system II carrier protein [Actinomyces dentalis]|uniref:branched-chain amino acid transport system II carrier protein n=1 Tax=Actinomyces dentalis TaxID=272548 RepID=UPI0003FD96B1|nr:branched-chain amino acid transport system II carrier protein [Actinomyces dentalis]